MKINALMLGIFLVTFVMAPCVAAEKKPPDTAQAKAVVEKERTDRAQKCSEEIDQALKKFSCTIELGIMITSKGNFPRIQIVPQDK